MKQQNYNWFWVFITLMIVACTNKESKETNKITEPKESTIVVKQEPKVLSAEEIYGQSINKVAMIISYKEGVPYSQGTGFFVDKNTLITNFHCVDGADRLEFKITGNEEIYKGAKIMKASEEYDLAIITTKQDFSYLKIDSLGNEKIGSKIYAIGNPRGLEGTLSDGILSGKRDENGIEYLQITAPINPGNSGGPVLNKDGDVIGVATFTFKNSQNLNFAMPIKYISRCTDYVKKEPIQKQKKHLYTDEDNAVSIPKFSIVSHYDPCQAFVAIRNNTEQYVNGIMGQMIFYDRVGEMYDYFNFTIRESIAPKMTKQTYIEIGDERIHPDQYWGTPEQLYYKLKETPKSGIFRFSYTGGSSSWVKNQARTIEIRILYYDLEE